MLHRMKSDIENMGMKYEDYLKHLGKTEADLEKSGELMLKSERNFKLLFQKLLNWKNYCLS